MALSEERCVLGIGNRQDLNTGSRFKARFFCDNVRSCCTTDGEELFAVLIKLDMKVTKHPMDTMIEVVDENRDEVLDR